MPEDMEHRGQDMRSVVLCREGGGLGDVLCTLPVARAYHEAGWFVQYLALSGYAEVVEACPFVHVVHAATKQSRRGRHAPITRKYLEAHGVQSPDHAVDLWCPAWKHEAATRGQPWRNRLECFAASGAVLDKLGSNPLAGVVDVELERPAWLAEGLVYDVFQAHTQDCVRNVPWTLYEPYMAPDGVLSVGLGTHQMIQPMPWDKYACDLKWPVLCWVVKNARHIYCGDSGILHLANVYGTPVTAWFGPTCGKLICKHYTNATVIQGRDCGPCYYQANMGWDNCRHKMVHCKALQAI